MRRNKKAFVIAMVSAAAFVSTKGEALSAAAQNEAALTTPPGITLQEYAGAGRFQGAFNQPL